MNKFFYSFIIVIIVLIIASWAVFFLYEPLPTSNEVGDYSDYRGSRLEQMETINSLEESLSISKNLFAAFITFASILVAVLLGLKLYRMEENFKKEMDDYRTRTNKSLKSILKRMNSSFKSSKNNNSSVHDEGEISINQIEYHSDNGSEPKLGYYFSRKMIDAAIHYGQALDAVGVDESERLNVYNFLVQSIYRAKYHLENFITDFNKNPNFETVDQNDIISIKKDLSNQKIYNQIEEIKEKMHKYHINEDILLITELDDLYKQFLKNKKLS